MVVSRRVAITAFDSGPLQLTSEELEPRLEATWQHRGESHRGRAIQPHEGYDEWYAFERDIPEFGDVEVFVNYGGYADVADDRASDFLSKMRHPADTAPRDS